MDEFSNSSMTALPNMSMPPPNMAYGARFDHRNSAYPRPFFKPFASFGPRGPLSTMTLEDFDGKRLRKSVMRKTVDYNSAIIKALEFRVWQRDFRDRRALQPDVMYYPDLLPPPSYPDNPINCVTTRFVKTATNKMRCPIFCMAWTPEGRRLVTGASSGEFTLWNGLTFNFETILQAHDSPVRTMVWTHNDSWMVTGDHAGYVKYWQSNMNNVKMFQAHKEALRGISFSPSDTKFVTCSDDGTLRIWDFFRCYEEKILRGHGADVKCVHWHPQKALIISGSKDNQQPIKLWDPKTGQSLATLHAHKSTVMDLKWNENGNWLITASRDHLLKLFDVRNLSQEVQTFRGHKKEASSVAWHPIHEGLFSSGGSDGSIMFWHVGADKEVGAIEQAHDSIVWTLAWHPLGHILCSGSNDHTSKFWTRNRPGDLMRDKYNLNTLPAGIAGLEDTDVVSEEPVSVIPGMGPEDKVEIGDVSENLSIPGLDLDIIQMSCDDKPNKSKKVPYNKPIPRNFQAQWNETGVVDDDDDAVDTINEVITHIVENTPGVVPLNKLEPTAMIMYGKLVNVEPGSKLEKAISEGPEALKRFIASGGVEELLDVMPHEEDDDDDFYDYNEEDEESPPPSLTGARLKLPEPLPSSKTSQNQRSNMADNGNNNTASGKPRKSRFSDITVQDQDLRSIYGQTVQNQRVGDMDMRNLSDVDMRSLNPPEQDVDLRNVRGMADEDLRSQNFRQFGNYDNDMRERNRFDSPVGFDRNFGSRDQDSRPWNDDVRRQGDGFGPPRSSDRQFGDSGFSNFRQPAARFNGPAAADFDYRQEGSGPFRRPDSPNRFRSDAFADTGKPFRDEFQYRQEGQGRFASEGASQFRDYRSDEAGQFRPYDDDDRQDWNGREGGFRNRPYGQRASGRGGSRGTSRGFQSSNRGGMRSRGRF